MKKIILPMLLFICGILHSEESKPWPDVRSMIYTYYETLNYDYADKTFEHCLALSSLLEEITKKIISESPDREVELSKLIEPNSQLMILQRKLALKVGEDGDENAFERFQEIFSDYYVWVMSSPLLNQEFNMKLKTITEDMDMCTAFSDKL